VMHSA